MPHQCVRCNKVYSDGSQELLKGCDCGGKFFFYVREKHLKKAEEITQKLTKEEKKQIEEDIFDIVDMEKDDRPVILDLETIRVLKPGKYELDVVKMFKGDSLVYKLDEGKYIIDLLSTFKSLRERKK